MSDKAHFFKRGAAKSVCGMKDAADTERTANSRDGRCSLCMAIVERKGLRA